jgi:hypothetical protein
MGGDGLLLREVYVLLLLQPSLCQPTARRHALMGRKFMRPHSHRVDAQVLIGKLFFLPHLRRVEGSRHVTGKWGQWLFRNSTDDGTRGSFPALVRARHGPPINPTTMHDILFILPPARGDNHVGD